MTTEQIEKAIEKIRPEKCDIDGWIVVEYKDLEIIRNTIGKLKKENEKLKYNARGQVNDYFKDKYADEVLKNADLIKDFELTCYKNYELKQENEKLKEELKNRPIVDFTFDVYKELEDYKSRCLKAIEYIMTNLISEYDIENGGCVSGSDLPVDAITPILDTLLGSDKNE